MFSDTYKIKCVDDVVYEVEGEVKQLILAIIHLLYVGRIVKQYNKSQILASDIIT